jgi:hypothetical protein
MPTQQECIDQCAADEVTCQRNAEAALQTMLASCDTISDPTEKNLCIAAAYDAFGNNIRACRETYTNCVQRCKDRYP